MLLCWPRGRTDHSDGGRYCRDSRGPVELGYCLCSERQFANRARLHISSKEADIERVNFEEFWSNLVIG